MTFPEQRFTLVFLTFAIAALAVSVGPRSLFASETHETVPAQRWFEDLMITEIDKSRIGTVKNVLLRRESATFHVDWGVFHFFRPHRLGESERVTGAIFTGSGTMTYSPATEVERKHLAIFAKADTLTVRFEVLYVRFSDGTFEELEEHIEWTGKKHAHPEARKESCEELVSPDVPFTLLQSALLGVDPGYFYAHIGPKGNTKEPYFYIVDPLSQEEISFAQRSLGHGSEIVNRFHLPAQYDSGVDLAHEDSDVMEALHYEIEAGFEGDGRLRAKTTIQAVARKGPLWAVEPSLMRKARVHSVHSTDRAMSFHREGGSAALRIFLEEPLAQGDSLVFDVEYEGTALEKTWAGFSVLDPAGWYPRFGRVHATFDLTYSCPQDYQVVSVGHLVEATDEGKRTTSRYVVEAPARFAAFNFGKFSTYTIHPEHELLPPVTVYMSEEGRRLKRRVMQRAGIRSVDNPEEIVARDIAEAAKLFQWLFGGCPVDSISVTQVPDAHGISFPGLVHLSFAGRYTEWMEAFHGHEVAHQWWGNSVAPRTYHDYWLSEGMAEFWGDYYAAWSQKDDLTMLLMMGSARHHLIENRKAFQRDRTPIAPLWLGTRASSSETGSDYGILIYEKGAFVLYMLRSMLLDLSDLSDEAFVDLIRSCYAKYEGREISTADFQRHVEDSVGMDMDWFFKQWVYGTDIPTYRFGWGYTARDDGNYVVQCTVEQENVPDDFRMYVILKVEFDDGQYAHFRVLVDEPVERFNLPALPFEPKNVVFNDLHSVLAEVESL